MPIAIQKEMMDESYLQHLEHLTVEIGAGAPIHGYCEPISEDGYYYWSQNDMAVLEDPDMLKLRGLPLSHEQRELGGNQRRTYACPPGRRDDAPTNGNPYLCPDLITEDPFYLYCYENGCSCDNVGCQPAIQTLSGRSKIYCNEVNSCTNLDLYVQPESPFNRVRVNCFAANACPDVKFTGGFYVTCKGGVGACNGVTVESVNGVNAIDCESADACAGLTEIGNNKFNCRDEAYACRGLIINEGDQIYCRDADACKGAISLGGSISCGGNSCNGITEICYNPEETSTCNGDLGTDVIVVLTELRQELLGIVRTMTTPRCVGFLTPKALTLLVLCSTMKGRMPCVDRLAVLECPSNAPTVTASPSQSPSESLAPSQSNMPSAMPSSSSAPSDVPSSIPSATPSVSLAPSQSSNPSQAPSASGAPSATPSESTMPSTDSVPMEGKKGNMGKKNALSLMEQEPLSDSLLLAGKTGRGKKGFA
ncbi:MAG: hypothetical protein SGARI_000773 [Bacillariaceae sp.]